MPLLRYRPCLPYTLQRYVSDVWLSLCFLLISLSSSPFLLWPHPRNIRGCVLIYDFSLCTIFPSIHLLAYSPHPSLPYPSPFALPLNSRLPTHLSHLLPAHRYRPSFQLTPPRSSLLRLIPPPTYLFSNLSRLQLIFSSTYPASLCLRADLPPNLYPFPTHLSSNSPKTYLRYRDH